ncbi:P-loop NTPase family protein [Klebsiella variicola]|uniref:conjugal transfer protein TraL n=1 Tax=Klebsiella variicola TaxID=244366 RepID=UPI001E5F0929|nr:conjugal transfer protein TraL [Klebsiella variicola]
MNATTAKIKRLSAEVIKIIEDNKIVQSRFDSMFEAILTNPDQTFVVDNGASTFLPLSQYFLDNCVMEMFDDIEQDVYIHTVIVGGQPMSDTLEGFEAISKLVSGSKVKVVAWINEFLGVPMLSGKHILETNFFSKNGANLAGTVVITDRKSDAYDSDIQKMTSLSLTLGEVKESDTFNIMAKSRLNRVFNDIYKQLDDIYGE